MPTPSPTATIDLLRPDIPEVDSALFDHDHHGRVDTATIEAAFAATVAHYPQAPVVALGDDGVGVRMPASVLLRANRVAEIRSGLDVIAFDANVIAAWERVLTYGASRCRVRVARTPDITGTNHLFDLREHHGVIVVLTVMDLAIDGGRTVHDPDAPKDAYRPHFATIVRDPASLVVSVDDAYTQITGWTAEDLVGRRLLDKIHPDDTALAIDHWMQMLADPSFDRRVRLRHRHRDGSWIWFEVAARNLLADPERACVVSEMHDISEETAALELLREREFLLTQMAETIPVGLLQIDGERRVIYTNGRLHQIVGRSLRPSFDEQLATVAPADRVLLDRAVDGVLEAGGQADLEVSTVAGDDYDGAICTISVRALHHPDGAVRGALVCVTDVTESTRMRDELHERATFDDLTGCHNRASIMQTLEQTIADGGDQDSRAVVYVDVDGFKMVNDRRGHAAGDEMLRGVARRLRDAIREGDTLGRIGGDEFLMVCPRIGGRDEAVGLTERILAAIASGAPVSIGIAWSTGAEFDADTLVARADAAMYAAKRDGGDAARLAA